MDELLKKAVYRPKSVPSPGIPLGGRSVGHYRVPVHWREGPEVKHFVQVFWGIRGAGTLMFNGDRRLLKPGHIGIYFPGMEHNVAALDEPWEYRWWTMDGPLASTIVRGFNLGGEVYKAGVADTSLFDELQVAIQDLSASGERCASGVAYRLLASIGRSAPLQPHDLLVERILTLVHRHWQDPGFGVQDLTARLLLHRSTVSRLFHRSVGVTVVEYVTRLRVQNALSLLKQSLLPIADIARQCGYEDPNYFSRLIRKRTGLSPRQFRLS